MQASRNSQQNLKIVEPTLKKHTSHAKPRKATSKTAKRRSTSTFLEVELELVLVTSRSLCLAMLFLVFALLLVLLDRGPLIMHGLIWGRRTNN